MIFFKRKRSTSSKKILLIRTLYDSIYHVNNLYLVIQTVKKIVFLTYNVIYTQIISVYLYFSHTPPLQVQNTIYLFLLCGLPLFKCSNALGNIQLSSLTGP